VQVSGGQLISRIRSQWDSVHPGIPCYRT
jgi:hypothetical protein